jgi:transposase
LTLRIAFIKIIGYRFYMYIRRTHTNNSATGERYYTYRLVSSHRAEGKVRQVTLLNLGRNFSIEQEYWSILCARVEQIMSHQHSLSIIECPAKVEKEAQRLVEQLLPQQTTTPVKPVTPGKQEVIDKAQGDMQTVDVDSLELSRPRSVGVEQLGLWAMLQLGFSELLTHLGINASQREVIIGSIIARMAAPSSELAAYRWLGNQSALGELLDFDYETMSLMSLYRASDVLYKHRKTIETTLFSRVIDLFGLDTTITLYDLTNTYFEGEMPCCTKALHGRSKEKRSDCPLITLALVVDSSGFVRSSQTFAGNVSEPGTLETMLKKLNAPTHALVVMDAGIASSDNINWLCEQGYRYLVVSRERNKQFDSHQSVAITTASKSLVHCQKILSEDAKEVRLYCYSEAREQKEQAMNQRVITRFEKEIQALAEGLKRPRTQKKSDKIHQRIGRLKEKYCGIGQHYQIEVQCDETGKIATELNWSKQAVEGTRLTHPGVYCLRSNETTWDEEKLWSTYTTLTDLEAVIRSLKSELGLRPVFHAKEERVEGHLFITVLAYQFVQVIRKHLKLQGINASWATIRQIMAGQCRITASFLQKDGKAIHIRKATRCEPEQLEIYRTLKINPAPGGVRKSII